MWMTGRSLLDGFAADVEMLTRGPHMIGGRIGVVATEGEPIQIGILHP
jgi:hypothetical protein